jgi:hypothetical protein
MLQCNLKEIKMVAGGYLDFDNDHNVLKIDGNRILNKIMPVWRKSVKRFWSYRIYCAWVSYHFMDGKMRGGMTQMQPNSREFSREQNDASLESISQTVQNL